MAIEQASHTIIANVGDPHRYRRIPCGRRERCDSRSQVVEMLVVPASCFRAIYAA